ncbi:MAG: hypothetical protein ACPHW5_07560 [Candidatus Puniceispirillales bacterium]
MNRDTYSEPDIFFSHRRATHKGEPDTGRLMTMIGLNRSVEPDSDKPI